MNDKVPGSEHLRRGAHRVGRAAVWRDLLAQARLQPVDRAREQGATVLCGGRVSEDPRYADGFFYEPTAVADITPAHDLWYDEVFGPVTLVRPFRDEADAVVQANDCEFGPAASVWTRDVGGAIRVADQLDIGIVWINDHHRIDPASPRAARRTAVSARRTDGTPTAAPPHAAPDHQRRAGSSG